MSDKESFLRTCIGKVTRLLKNLPKRDFDLGKRSLEAHARDLIEELHIVENKKNSEEEE